MSIQGAENIRDELFKATDKLKNPKVNYISDPDLGKPYRCIFVRKRYRVIYRRTEDTIRIVYIFDTKRERKKLYKIKKSL